jgi:NitT/TauT family transport system substrate-binding protein
MKRVILVAVLMLPGCQSRKGAEIRLAVQPPATNNYPSHLAQWLGFYRQEGLDVTISNVAGASKVLEALVGSSADVAGGVYEQTIQMAADGRPVVCFASLLRSPNFAVVSASADVKKIGDLRGKTVGVSSVGSPSQFYLNYLLAGVGVPPAEVGTAGIGQGATAAAAVERKQVAAAVVFGSAITVAEARGARILADSRTPEGLRAIFGIDDYPASCLLAREDWLRANPDLARRMSRAILRALAWIREHSPEEILAQVPPEFRVGEAAAEMEAIRLAKPMYSLDGRIHPESAEAVRRVLAGSLDRVRDAKIDLSRTYTNEFLP